MIDISMEISQEMPVYKDRKEKKPDIKTLSRHEENGVHQSEIKLDLHTGTHIDAPLHMVEGGETTEIYDLEKFISSARVLDLTEKEEKITRQDLEQYEITENEFLLLKTQNSFREDFTTNFVYLAADGADFLAEKKVKGVGIDSLGIERAQPEHPTHKNLLEEKILILEGLRLAEVETGEYKLICFPLKIKQVEGAPCRAILFA